MTNEFVIPDRRGIVAEYLLNGNANDTSGNGYNGTASNVTYSRTERGYQTYSGNFNGSSSYISMGDVLDFEKTDSFSIWYVGIVNSTTEANLVSKQQNSGSYVGYWLAISWGGKPRFFIYAGWESGGSIIVDYPSAINDGKSHTLYATYDGSNSASGVKLYLDGKLVSWTVIGNFPVTGSLITSASFQISWRWGSAIPLNWTGQSVRIFNRALSETEIRNWYLESLRALGGSTLSGLTDGLVAQINTADGNELSDIVWGVAVTKTSWTATTDNLGYARAITNPNYSWPSVTYTTGYAFENAGSGWVLTQTPSGLSATGINRTTTLREIFLFNRTLSTDEKNALETLCKLDYVLPFDGAIRYGLPTQLKEGCVLFIPWVVNGTTAYDASGSGNHWTLVNTPTPARGGLWGYEGLKFNWSNQYGTRSYSRSDAFSYAFTLEPLSNQSGSFKMAVGLTDGWSNGFSTFSFDHSSSTYQNAHYCFTTWGAGLYSCKTTSPMSANGKYRIVCDYDGNTNWVIRVSVNGRIENTVTIGWKVNATSAIVFGSQTPSFGLMDCKLSNLVFHNRILSADEIRLDASTFFVP